MAKRTLYFADLTHTAQGIGAPTFPLGVSFVASDTFKEAVEIVSRLVGGILSMTSRPRTNAKADHAFCNAVLLKLLPAMSFTSFEEGIRRTFEAESQRHQVSAGVLR